MNENGWQCWWHANRFYLLSRRKLNSVTRSNRGELTAAVLQGLPGLGAFVSLLTGSVHITGCNSYTPDAVTLLLCARKRGVLTRIHGTEVEVLKRWLSCANRY